jgi:hypothetical protein
LKVSSDLAAPRAHHFAKRIARNGINPAQGFVWAFPVLASYTLTHSWSRELKRRRRTTLAATTFLVPDDEIVLTRHYREDHCTITAAEAVGFIRSRPDPRGYEIMSTPAISCGFVCCRRLSAGATIRRRRASRRGGTWGSTVVSVWRTQDNEGFRTCLPDVGDGGADHLVAIALGQSDISLGDVWAATRRNTWRMALGPLACIILLGIPGAIMFHLNGMNRLSAAAVLTLLDLISIIGGVVGIQYQQRGVGR